MVLWGFVFFSVCPPPFLPCIPPCGTLLPACTHVSTALVIWSRLPSVLFSCPIAVLGRGPWRFPAMPGGRSSLASLSSLPSLPSALFCLSPALLLFLSCSVCSPLVFPAPGLYLAGSQAPLGLRPILRPVGRLGRPPEIPLREDSPVFRPRRPPLHQFPDAGAGRPLRFNAGLWHGVFLCKTRCTFVPLLAPCFPLLPRGPVPSGSPALVYLSVASLVALIAAHTRPACAPCSPLRYPCLAALCPHPRLPFLSAVTLWVLSVLFCPLSLPLPCIHSCVPPVCSTPAPLRRPYPFPWWLSYPCALPLFSDPLPFRDAMGSR